MSSQPERTESLVTEGSAEAHKASQMKQKLTLIGHYLSLGLAPFISICALIIAIYAVSENKSGEDQLNKSKARIENLNVSLSATKSELEKFKIAIVQINGLQEDLHKKEDERMAKIIQNVTPLQVKLKIFPTIEEQLRQVATTSAVAPAVASSVSVASAVAATAEKTKNPQVKAMKEAIDKYNKNN
jgi:hypothetical protein